MSLNDGIEAEKNEKNKDSFWYQTQGPGRNPQMNQAAAARTTSQAEFKYPFLLDTVVWNHRFRVYYLKST